MKCFRLRCYVNNSFLVFHQGTKHWKTIKHSRFALVFHTVFSCLDPLMKHSNSLFTYNINNEFVCVFAVYINMTLFNNYYWMRLSMIWRIIKPEVIKANSSLDNSSCCAKTEFNNCLIIYFKNSKQTEAISILFVLSKKQFLKAHTDRTRFGNATRIFSFQWHLTLIFFNVFQIFWTT
jgi:hypothetical protein